MADNGAGRKGALQNLNVLQVERWMDGRFIMIQLYTYNNIYMILLESS